MQLTNRNNNQYRITVEQLEPTKQTLMFEFEDREDLFALVDNMKKGSELDNASSTRLAVALRLFGPLVIAHRKHPLFIDFMPSFKVFMNNLKKRIKSVAAAN
ncbi:DUF3861 domain-containing protein [Shewanella marina]|uniref:DUF3861 domain-containing protein n=1 Tax=Shewanella marina TaxID=487319 RepID=UPI000471D607|nr:DUF3861 domain-containing protein [Shewanella marina]